jgi:DNA replication and repair protein RecF
VHLAHLRLRDFRNYARLDADFAPGFHVLLGGNAQGKTNILEAVYLLATLRSFRGVGGAQMIRHGQKGWFIGARVVAQADHDIRMYWSPAERKLSLDARPVKRLPDFLGTLRAVVFCTEDLLLVKGTARVRRRFMDLLLAQTHAPYLPLLQRYSAALRARNSLLKQRAPDDATLEGFSKELVAAGAELLRHRRELIPRVAPLAQEAFRLVAAGAQEELRLDYAPGVKGEFTADLAKSRERERAMRMTLVGPHRDDLRLLINDRPAAQFGSEGQKRTLAIALKMAQAGFLAATHGTPPVLLIDDVMGELDATRRNGLLPLLERSDHARGQVFMTCTSENWPRELGARLHRWQVASGALSRM